MAALPGTAFGGGFESLAIARALVHCRGFADPYLPLATGATAHLAPLYPAYLAILIRGLGDGPAMHFAAVLLTAFAFGALIAMLPPLACRLFGNATPGVLAGFACVVFPSFQMLPQWDAVFLATGLAGFCLLTLRPLTSVWVSGLSAGAICLLNPAAIPFLLVWFAILSLLKKKVAYASGSVSVLAIACAICFPWMLRNKLVLGVFCLRDDAGLELQVNNNDLAHAQFLDCWTAQRRYHPNANLNEARAVARMGEARYNARKFDEAIAWIGTHVRRFTALSVERWLFFWFPDLRDAPFSWGIWTLTVLSLPCFLLSLRSPITPQSGLAFALMAFSFPYALVNASVRYRIPVLWITALFAGQFLCACLNVKRGGRRECASCETTSALSRLSQELCDQHNIAIRFSSNQCKLVRIARTRNQE